MTQSFIEHDRCPDSWLHGVLADLEWFSRLLPTALPDPDAMHSGDLTSLIDAWQQPNCPWKSMLKRALSKHLDQEHMMSEVDHFHHWAYRIVKQAGATILTNDDVWTDMAFGEFVCDCGRRFTTAQGLALHRRKVHQIFSPEHSMIDGATCAHCLKFFWSSARLQQHLFYMPRNGGVNSCYEALRAQGFQIERQTINIPKELVGTVRLDALQASGPQFQGHTQTQKEVVHILADCAL